VPMRHLPLNTWLVIDQKSLQAHATLVSQHATQRDAETARDKRNKDLAELHYCACIVLEPIAQRMGGLQAREQRPGTPRNEPSDGGPWNANNHR
jgi:hypothetical protein